MAGQYGTVDIRRKVSLRGKVAGMKAGRRSKFKQQVITHQEETEPRHLRPFLRIQKDNIGKHVRDAYPAKHARKPDIGYGLYLEPVSYTHLRAHETGRNL